MISFPEAPDRASENWPLVVASDAAKLSEVKAIEGCASSSFIVYVSCVVPRVEFVGLLKVIITVSLTSSSISSTIVRSKVA